METHITPSRREYGTMTTEQLREAFLVADLFRPGEIQARLTELDRAIVGSAVPLGSVLSLSAVCGDPSIGGRRELGIVNLGSSGAAVVDGRTFDLQPRDVLYVGRGFRDVEFSSGDCSAPARFYWLSYPAQADHPCAVVRRSEADKVTLGNPQEANSRTIHKYIHPARAASSQIVMGITELEDGSVWNTMPPHTHPRRSEIYLYYGLDEEAVVFHFLGEPTATRHVVVRDFQAVLSPHWSIHAGVGTRSYSFVWCMGGENQEFGDVNPVAAKELK